MVSKLKGVAPVEAKPRKPVILIFGEPAVGKTYGATGFPKPYFCDSEGGAILGQYTKRLKDAGGMYFGPDQGAMDAKEILEQVEALATEKHPYKTFVLDSISKLHNTEISKEQERMEKAGDKDAFGASKKPAVNMTRKLVRWLNRLDMAVILIAHQKALWKAGEQVGETFDAFDKLEYELDLVLQIKKAGERRVAVVRKSRLETFPTGQVFDWNYDTFAEKWGKDVLEKEQQPLVLATAEQLFAFNELLETVKLPEGQTDKWLKHFDVDSFEEMETNSMQKLIDQIKTKLVPTPKKEK